METDVPEFGMHSLQSACEQPWEFVEIGGLFRNTDLEARFFAANHVYLECSSPVLLAATCHETADGCEYFGIVVISDASQIQGFREGPYQPHNKPLCVMLDAVGGASASAAFMSESRRVVCIPSTDDGPRRAAGIVIEGASGSLYVMADEAMPMGIQVEWIGSV